MWQPDASGLEQIVHVLRNANSSDTATQRHVQARLEEFGQIGDYDNYLMYVLTAMPAEHESVRAVAGLLLKNRIRQAHHATLPAAVLAYLKHGCIAHVGDPLPLVRNTVGTLLTTIMSLVGLHAWPDAIVRLADLIDHADYNVSEGAFSALQKICEDFAGDFESCPGTPLQVLLPKFINHSASSHPKIRVHALSCMNFLIQQRSPSVLQNVNAYIGALSQRTADPSGDVRRLVCQAFVMILDASPEVIAAQISGVGEFLLHALQDGEEQVELESCEFWLNLAEKEEFLQLIHSFLPRLVPLLLKSMVYSEEDIITLDTEDSQSRNDDQDVKPRHHKAKTRGDDDDDSDDDDDEVYAAWNLRKCAAATIDCLSNMIGGEILEFLLPSLQEKLSSSEWKDQEAGILVLGAIAEGCSEAIQGHLPQLIPFLFQSLKHPKPLVRSISCWTLSRYGRWCIDLFGTPNDNKYFESLLLSLMTDNNKRVQEAACSAIATVEEDAQEQIAPFVHPLLQVFSTCFERYHHKNLLILFDAVGTMAESVGTALNTPQHVNLLMPPLIQKWNTMDDDDTDLFALLECLSSVAIALGPNFEPFATSVYERCVRLVQKTLTQDANEEPDKDFMIVALDLISAIAQGIGSNFATLISKQQPPFVEILQHCSKDDVSEVRQSCFALYGDLAMYCYQQLQPYLQNIIPVLIEHITPHIDLSESSVCNNACWAMGEITLRYGPDIAQISNVLVERYVSILKKTQLPRTLHENAAIAIGRLGVIVPEMVAPHLEAFAEQWCKSLRHTQDNSEKISAFLGFSKMVQINPSAMLKGALPLFFDAVGNCNDPTPELYELLNKVMSGYKAIMGDQWDGYYRNFPENLRQRLSQRYAL